MSQADKKLIENFLPDPLLRERAVKYLGLAEMDSPDWEGLPKRLGEQVRRFERLQIATAYARLHRTNDPALINSQELLTRKTVKDLLAELGPTGKRLAEQVEGRSIDALPNLVLRELAKEVSGDTSDLFTASGACRIAATQLETAVKEAGDGKGAPFEMLAAHATATGSVTNGRWTKAIPGGIPALALLWVSSLIGLGDLENDSTTEHYHG